MKVLVYAPVFESGGITSYWKQISEFLPSWNIDFFTNKKGREFFKYVPDDRINDGIVWNRYFETTKNFKECITRTNPDLIIFNGTLGEVFIFPFLLSRYFRRNKVPIICIYHNRELYKSRYKALINKWGM